MLSEKDARTKLCPMMLPQAYELRRDEIVCCTNECMAWTPVATRDGEEPGGYCGLAPQPRREGWW